MQALADSWFTVIILLSLATIFFMMFLPVGKLIWVTRAFATSTVGVFIMSFWACGMWYVSVLILLCLLIFGIGEFFNNHSCESFVNKNNPFN